jgi:hypothetical protein
MNKTTNTLIAAIAALMLSGGAYAQSNNTLATPTVKSPAASPPTSGYGSPGTMNSESSAGSQDSSQSNRANNNATSVTPAYGANNTLATPTTKSPVAK